MYEGFHIWTFLAGLPLGIVIAAIILYFNWRNGKKERRFDERYTNIHRHARSVSWMATTIALIIAWGIVIIIEGPKLAFFVITGLWFVHMISYLIGAVIANTKN